MNTNETSSVISVLLPVMNEIRSLNQTIEIITETNPKQVFEFVIILSPKSSEAASENAYKLKIEGKNNILVIVQTLPFLGGALINGIDSSSGDHIILMASDLETDPSTVTELIEESKKFPNTIIATTRWCGDKAGFEGYKKTKLVLNKLFQNSIRKLYRTNLTDLTFGFRLYPRETLIGYEWKSLNFAFLLESILRPVNSGVKTREVSTRWKLRNEGYSSNSWRFYFSYFKLAFLIKVGK